MNNNFRNAELLGKLERHPLRASLARALDASELFAGDIEHIKLDRRLSAEGRDDARRAKLRTALRDNRDARAPLEQMQKKLEQKRKAITMPKFADDDVVGFLRRQELRAALRGAANTGQRALMLQDPAFADACLEQPAALSGLHVVEGQPGEDASLVEKTKSERLEKLYASELAEIAELETTIAEAAGIFDLALVDLKFHSELDDRTFTAFTAPIMNRKNAPWLVKSGDAVMRVRPEKKGTPELHQPASADEIRDGIYFESEAAYLASRAA
jgi:hypothetical protein